MTNTITNSVPIQNPVSRIQQHPESSIAAPPSTGNPSIHQSINPSILSSAPVVPWPEPVDAANLLTTLGATLRRFVILPKWAPETLALWVVHTYAFQLRDVRTYLGIQSPEKRCGKTTLLAVLAELANRAVTAANISSPAFFRVIEELQPTLFIDETDTFLQGNEQLKGILNSGYNKKTSYVLRVVSQGPSSQSASESPANLDTSGRVIRFSCWCPKVMASIGPLPDTLADRCIIIPMERKTSAETCDRLRNLDAKDLRRQCARFVLDNQTAIAAACPAPPAGLNDRAADIWEPLLALADLAGGDWPSLARQAAIALAASAQESNPIGSLLIDIFFLFSIQDSDRIHTRNLVEELCAMGDRPWRELAQGKAITELWLARQLRPYGIRPRMMRTADKQARGYLKDDCMEAFRRYIPKSEKDALLASLAGGAAPPSRSGQPPAVASPEVPISVAAA
jgi:putative DNA primase/helicase